MRLSKSLPLERLASVHLGLVVQSNDLLSSQESGKAKDAILFGRDVSRYGNAEPNHWFAFGRTPIVGGTKNPEVYANGPRIVLQAIRNLKLPRRLVGTIVPAGTFTIGTLHNIIVRDGCTSPHYLLGLLSSNLLNEFYKGNFPEHRIKGAYLEQLPIRPIDFSKPADKARHDRMVALVERMLELNRKLAAAKSPDEKTRLDRDLKATDAEIDRLVYDLYGLTEEEIKIVEGQA